MNSIRLFRNVCLATATFATLISSPSLQAIDYTWTGTANPGAFTGTGNWASSAPGTVPGSGDNIVNPLLFNAIGLTGPQTVSNVLATYDTSSWSFLGQSATAALTVSGTIGKSGTGTLVFRRSGAALAIDAGAVSVSGGTLAFGSNTASQWITGVSSDVTNVSGGSLNFIVGADSSTANNGTAFMGAMSVTGTGIVNVRNGAGAGTVEVTSLSGGDATAVVRSVASNLAASGTLRINSTADASFSGSLANGTAAAVSATLALEKTGNFTQTLTGANTYSGGTTVTAGTLLINNASGSGTGSGAVAVGVSGTLGGTGNIAGVTTIDGTLAPGAAGVAGLLTISNDLTLNGNAANALIQIIGTSRGVAGGYDAINLGASEILTYDGTLTLTMTGLIADGTYDIFSFDTAAAGGFDAIAFAGGAYSGTWTEGTPGVWTASSAGQSFTFSETTGDLLVAAIPEPTAALLCGLTGVVLLLRRKRARVVR